jgi:O-antigen/teichoic acid export membrane protein
VGLDGLDGFVNLWVRLQTRGLLRDTAHLSIGQSLRLVIQAIYFVLVARSLGPVAYGAFVTVVAMAALLGPFAGIGTTNLFIKNVRSGKREAAICWGNGILLTVVSGTLLTLLALGLTYLVRLKTGAYVVVLICVADLVFLKLTDLAAFGFTALDQMKQTSIQSVVASLLRLAGIVALLLTVRRVTLDRWVALPLHHPARCGLRGRERFPTLGAPSDELARPARRHRRGCVLQHRRISLFGL